jgi:hypothetical protein
MVSAGGLVSVRRPFYVEDLRSFVEARATCGGRGSSAPSSSGPRSSSSEPAGEVGGLLAVLLLQLFSSPSCELAMAEKGDFPSAKISSAASRSAPAPGGRRTGDAAARSPSASVMDKGWDPRDPVVISGFFGVCCMHCVG